MSTPELTLENTLNELARYGEPSLWLAALTGSRKWHCRIKLHVPAIGTSCEVQSEFIDSPERAATQCLERVHSIIPGAARAQPANKSRGVGLLQEHA